MSIFNTLLEKIKKQKVTFDNAITEGVNQQTASQVMRKPTIQPTEQKGLIGAIFSKKPTQPRFEARIGEGLNPQQTERAYEVIRTPSGVKKPLVEEVAQSTARNIGSAGLTVSTGIMGEPSDELDVNKIPVRYKKAFMSVFGDEPVKSVEQRIVESEEMLKNWGARIEEDIEADPKTKKFASFIKDNPTPFAFAGVLGSVGLDLTPFGGTSKGALKALTSANTIGDALITLQKMGVVDDVARNFAQEVVETKTDDAAENLIKRIAELQKTTKPNVIKEPITDIVEDSIKRGDNFTNKVSGEEFKIINKIDDDTIKIKSNKSGEEFNVKQKDFESLNKQSITDDTIDPLISEAKKYKSADEFVQSKVNTFHGGDEIKNVDLNKSNYAKTFFVSDNIDYAKSYAGKSGVINDIYIKPDSKLIDIKNATPEEITAIKNKIQEIKDTYVPYSNEGGFNPTFGNSADELVDGAIRGKSHFAEDPALVDVYKKLGYDGMVSYEDSAMRGKNIGVWNKDKVLTKSQLTDIWNKAQDVTETATKNIKQVEEFDALEKARKSELERKYFTSIKQSDEIAQEVAQELNLNYNPKSNKELVIRAQQRVSGNLEEAKKFARENNTDEAVATRVSIDKELSKAYYNETDPLKKAKIADDLKESITIHSKLATEEGRAVQANALLGKNTPEGMLRQTQKMIDNYKMKNPNSKISDISDKDVEFILNKTKEIEETASGIKQDVLKKEVTDYLETKIPTVWWRKIIHVWKAGLLTGVQTSGLNIMSNFFHGITELSKDIPATGIDIISSVFSKQRTKSLVNPVKYINGGFEGAKKGWNYFTTGVRNETGESALEFFKVNYDSKLGKFLGQYADTVYRALGTQDSPFYYGALKKSLYEQAQVFIINNKKKFNSVVDKNNFIKEFINNPTDEVLNLAIADAEIAVFRNDTVLGNFASAIQNAPVLGPILQTTVLPFAKTPSAVATAMLNYTPAGVVTTLYKTFKGGKFNQKEFAEGLGKVTTGLGLLWLGSELFKDKKITLGYPKDEKERAKWEAEGKKENSILINNKWIPLASFGPAGNVLTVGGYFMKGKEETGSVAGGSIVGLFGGIKSLTEQTFLTGVKRAVDVINEPEQKGVSWVGQTLSSIVPSFINNFANGFDNLQRDTKNGVLKPLISRIPVLRKTLLPKLDVWGQPLERNRTALGQTLSPVRLSNPIERPLNTEVERLALLGQDIRPTKIDKKLDGFDLEDNQYYTMQRMYGKIAVPTLEALITHPDYQKMDAEDQAYQFNKAVKEIKKGVKETLLPTFVHQKYELPDTINPKQSFELIKKLNKTDAFNKVNFEKQRKLILKLLNK